MEQAIKNKILLLDDLATKVKNLKEQEKVIVQSHGIFDLIHPGIIKHFNAAKKQGDVLVVTVIKDKDVRRGPGRPVFPENLRAENVASLEQVDYVSVVDDKTPFESVKKIEPNIFAKGQTYKERDQKIHKKIFKEEKEVYFGKSRIYETEGFSFSSSEIINKFLDTYHDKTKTFIKEFREKYRFQDILEKINSLQGLKVLLVGDGVIDEYYYCESMGKSPKAQLIVHKYINHEIFAGGAFATANHIAGLCNEVHLVTLLGKEDKREDFILNNLKPNVTPKFFYRDEGPTIIKRRYINQYQNQKIFEINHINDRYINEACEKDVLSYLISTIPSFDLVLISDFGHGFITDKIIKTVEKYSKKIAVNTQTNGANAGYNLITKYDKPDYICLDLPEARLATLDKFSDEEEIVIKLSKILKVDYLIITLGKGGSIGIDKKCGIYKAPALSTKVVDIIGAGDAFFAYTSLCFALDIPFDMVSFIGNAVGALAVQIIGNKKPVERYEVLEFVHAILK